VEATAIRGTTDAFDFIVLGTGMAGASVAAALASTACRCLWRQAARPEDADDLTVALAVERTSALTRWLH
jgi:choline dehydrogenase-like flavoprotein